MNGIEPRPSYRVLHVLDHSWPVVSGYSMRSRYLTSAQLQAGQQPRILTGPLHQLDDPSASDLVLDGVPYARTILSGAFSRRAIAGRWPLAREAAIVKLFSNRILQALRGAPADIIHAHSPALCGLAAWQASRSSGLPFVYEIRAFWEDAAVDQQRTTPRSLRYWMSRKVEDLVCERAHAVVGISDYVLQDLRARGLSPQKLFHVPNGVNADRFSPKPRDQQLARQLRLDHRPVLGFIGTMYRYEGIAWLVRAAAALRRRGNSFQLIIIGTGEDLPEVERAVQEAEVADCVHVLGPIPHEQIHRYYSVIDVLVYPRRRIRLTEAVTPLKPLEAMAQGKAVLGSDVGGMRELIRDKVTGLLFQADSVEDFCRQAERLIREEPWRRELGERARRSILEEKDWKILVGRYELVYAAAIGNARARELAADASRKGYQQIPL